MRTLITFTVILLFAFNQSLFSQTEIIGSGEYGRIFDFNYDPLNENTLYALTLGNHILKSTDNGVTWDVFYSHPEKATSLKELRILPDNRLSFYTNYTENTDALYIYDVNTMQTVKQIVPPIPPSADKWWISGYNIYEENTDIVILLQNFQIGLANYAKVYYTTDAGATWDEIYYHVDYNEVFVNNVAIDPSNPDKLFIARSNGPTDVIGGLFVSEDTGNTWTEKLPGITFDAITFNPENSDDILIGSSAAGALADAEDVYRSLDGGNTWTGIGINWTDEIQDNINAIVYNPTDLDNIIVLEENEVVITTDNFETWENYVYDYNATEGYVYGLTATFNPFNGQEVFINADYFPQYSTDGGVTMTRVKNPFFVTTGSVSFTASPEEHLYYSVQFGIIHRDMETGIDTPYDVKPIDYMSINPFTTVFTEKKIPGRVYSYSASFMGSALQVSDDHGANKIDVLSMFSNSLDAVATDPNNHGVAFASFSSFGEDFQVHKIDFSDPGNITSTQVSLPYLDYITGIVYFNGSSDNILMAIGTRIYKSTDAGSTWTLSSSGLDELIEFTDLILDLKANPLNDNQFTLTSNKGIFTSLDGGTTWTKIYEGLVHNMEHSDKVNGHMVATVNTSMMSEFKLIYSSNAGQTWNEVMPKHLLYLTASTSDYRFLEESAEVYIGTTDLGLVRYTVALDPVSSGNLIAPEMQVQVFPNPANTQITVKTNADYKEIELYNSKGQLVLTSNINTIDVSQLEKGLYMVKTIGYDGYSDYQKVIVQ